MKAIAFLICAAVVVIVGAIIFALVLPEQLAVVAGVLWGYSVGTLSVAYAINYLWEM